MLARAHSAPNPLLNNLHEVTQMKTHTSNEDTSEWPPRELCLLRRVHKECSMASVRRRVSLRFAFSRRFLADEPASLFARSDPNSKMRNPGKQ